MKLTKKFKELLEKAYALGFETSGEGWNGEYPFDGPSQFLKDKNWLAKRNKILKQLQKEN